MSELLKKFFERVNDNPNYMNSLALNLEINLLESKHQDPVKPRVFSKRYDNTGLIEGFSLTFPHVYLEKEIDFMLEYLNHDICKSNRKLREMLESSSRKESLAEMLKLNKIEGFVYNVAASDPFYDKNLPCVFIREHDKNGFLESYEVNERIFNLKPFKGSSDGFSREEHISFNLKPIEYEEIKPLVERVLIETKRKLLSK